MKRRVWEPVSKATELFIEMMSSFVYDHMTAYIRPQMKSCKIKDK